MMKRWEKDDKQPSTDTLMVVHDCIEKNNVSWKPESESSIDRYLQCQ